MKKQKKTEAQFSKAFVNKILEYFGKNPFSLYNYKQLSYALGISDRAGKVLVRAVLEQLCSDKVLIENKTGQYKLHPDKLNENLIKKSNITGYVEMKQTGKALLLPMNPAKTFIFRQPILIMLWTAIMLKCFFSRKGGQESLRAA